MSTSLVDESKSEKKKKEKKQKVEEDDDQMQTSSVADDSTLAEYSVNQVFLRKENILKIKSSI